MDKVELWEVLVMFSDNEISLKEAHEQISSMQTVSSNEVTVAFVKWLTENDYVLLYGGTPELIKDFRLATIDKDFTIEEVFQQFKNTTRSL